MVLNVEIFYPILLYGVFLRKYGWVIVYFVLFPVLAYGAAKQPCSASCSEKI